VQENGFVRVPLPFRSLSDLPLSLEDLLALGVKTYCEAYKYGETVTNNQRIIDQATKGK